VPACTNVTFGRVADLKRHHASRHGGHGKRRQQFWCPVGGCMSTLATNTAVPGALADLYYDRRSQRHGEKGRISPQRQDDGPFVTRARRYCWLVMGALFVAVGICGVGVVFGR
jgi:hypothetical protein